MAYTRLNFDVTPLPNTSFPHLITTHRMRKKAEQKQRRDKSRCSGLKSNMVPQSFISEMDARGLGKIFSEAIKNPQARVSIIKWYKNKTTPPLTKIYESTREVIPRSYYLLTTLKLSSMSNQFCGKGNPNFQ